MVGSGHFPQDDFPTHTMNAAAAVADNDDQWRFWDLQFGGLCMGGRIFSWGHRTILSQRRIQELGRGCVRQGLWGTKSPEAEAFSLNYTLILDFLSML